MRGRLFNSLSLFALPLTIWLGWFAQEMYKEKPL